MPDLTARDYEFLSYMAPLPDRTCSVASLHSRFTKEVAEYELDRLYSMNLVESAEYAPFDGVNLNLPISYCVTTEGIVALYEHLAALEDARQQRADEEAEKAADQEEYRAYAAKENRKNRHHDYFVTAFEVLLAYFIGVVSEAEFDIAGFVIELVEKTLSLFH